MSYSTIESVSKKVDQNFFIQFLNDENGTNEEIDLTNYNDPRVIRFNQIADEVTEEINASLRGRYKLPLSNVSSIIQSISDDRVIYNVKKRRVRDNMLDSEQKIFDNSTKQLQRIERGELLLDVDPVSPNAEGLAREIRVNKSADDKIFNNDVWNKY